MAAPRRPIVRAAAVATAVALGASALTLPAFAADEPAAEPAAGSPKAPPVYSVVDGTLNWGFKQSFRDYVVGMARGKITTSGGAQQAPSNGVFTFGGAKGTYDVGNHALKTSFKGGVRFTSTLHKFDITIADVKVHTKGKTGAIQADVSLNGAKQNDIDLATLDLNGIQPGHGEGGAVTFKDVPVKLTAKGAKAFNGMYRKGEVLDPATLTVKPGAPVPGPKPTPSTPTKPKPTPSTPTKPKPTPSTPAKPKKVVGGKMSWGLKESFRRYISGGGKITTAGGAKKKSNGFDFPYAKAKWSASAKTVDASFGGSVRFRFQGHGIDMTFSDLRVKASGKKGTLYADVKAQGRTRDDVKFATLDLSRVSYAAKNDVVLLSKVPAKFTAAGARQFANDTVGSPYKAGDPIDPVTVALTLSDRASIPPAAGSSGSTGSSGSGASGMGGDTGPAGSVGGGGSVGGDTGSLADNGSLAETGSEIPSGALFGIAGAVVAAGAGAVYAARRRGPGHGVRA
ncbi:HtaA domain-containing protein [Streptomyces sp. NRRL B-1347]|uniref:HtaA domain-containing protein n=1 Tax=Streptomyces sp. NRRL B-1347 TaxID=1476877 RepID=UPI0004C4ED5E|nr:HtaA domain-containing protein [Streptomyces sp. NRRL B-1347]